MTHTKTFNFVPTFTNLINDILENAPISEEIFGKNNFAKKPVTNIMEHKANYVLQMLAPGFQKADFQIAIENKLLTVSTNVEIAAENADAKKVKTEFEIQNFKRSFTISENIDVEKIQANYTNGILNITLLKKEPTAAENKTIIVE